MYFSYFYCLCAVNIIARTDSLCVLINRNLFQFSNVMMILYLRSSDFTNRRTVNKKEWKTIVNFYLQYAYLF